MSTSTVRNTYYMREWNKLPLNSLDRVVQTSQSGGPWVHVIYPGVLYKGKTPDRHDEIDLFPEFKNPRR